MVSSIYTRIKNTFGKALIQNLKVYESVPHSETYIDVRDEAFGIYFRGKKIRHIIVQNYENY